MNLDILKKSLFPFIKDNLDYLKELYPDDKDDVILNRVVNDCATDKLLSVINNKFKFIPVTKVFEGHYSPVLEALDDEKDLPHLYIVPKVFSFPVCILGSEDLGAGFGRCYNTQRLLSCIDSSGKFYSVEAYEIEDETLCVKTFIKSEKKLYNFDNFRKYFPKKYHDYLFEE